jgi:ribose 5-phosphate isomerase A
MKEQDTWKELAGNEAAKRIESGMVVGLGTGSTATYLLYALARRIGEGLRIAGAVPTSNATERLARDLAIPLTDLDTHPQLDVAIDGADEIDPELRLIKGGGGALLREKIVASSARRFIVIGDVTKQVGILGSSFPLPVEVIPFAATPVRKRLEALGASVQLRRSSPEQVFITDNGNVILDCSFPHGIADPTGLNQAIKQIVGIVESGLFLHMAQEAIIGGPGGVNIVRPT